MTIMDCPPIELILKKTPSNKNGRQLCNEGILWLFIKYRALVRVVTKQEISLLSVKEFAQKEDPDELNVHVCRYRPEDLSKLARTTKFNRKEIQLIYRGFKQECPSGLVDEDSFKAIFAQFFPQGDATQYAHYVFNTIQTSHSGKISFEDFLGILSKVSRGSIQEKLEWIFELYDLNKDGVITKNEMVDVVISIYDMLGSNATPQADDQSAEEHANHMFHLIDRNKDGVVTIEELMDWCCSNERILQSLQTLDTIL